MKKGEKPPTEDPRLSRWPYWISTVVLCLGILSTVLLVWINGISEDQLSESGLADAVKEMQIEAATSHLWLEEFTSGDTGIDLGRTLDGLDTAIKLADVIINGGESKTGMRLLPVRGADWLKEAQAIKLLLTDFKRIAVDRWEDPEHSGAGTPVDEQFDALFREIITRSEALGDHTERGQVLHRAASQRLFVSILFIWGMVVAFAVIGSWSLERQKLRAERALRQSHDELERRVEARTLALSETNLQLRKEILERIRAEESIMLYREVVNHMPLGLYVLRPDDPDDGHSLRLVATNPGATRFTGIPEEEVVGRTLGESSPMLIGSEIPKVYAEVARDGSIKDLGEVRSVDGRAPEGVFSVKAFPLPGRCLGVVFEDITERTRTETALRESEKKFRKLSVEFHALLDAIPDRITLLSPELTVLWVNRAAAQTMHEVSSDLTGEHCYRAWMGTSESCKDCPAARSFRTGDPESTEVTTPDGRIWNIRGFPIKSEDGQTVSVIELATDLTEKLAIQAEAMRTAHLASIGELAAGVAHEVNNPINGIINYAQILVDESGKGGCDRDIAERIMKEGARIANIVKSLLSFARERKEDKAPADIHDILSDSLVLIRSQLEKQGIRLIMDVPSVLPEIVANPQQIQQVCLNIITNARYALNQKYPGEHEDKVLEIHAEEATTGGKPCVALTFCDHGTGMPPEVLKKIMLPFFTTKPSGQGTGLGLCISHGIISDHGGKLTVESVEGQFTKVEIALPAWSRQ